MIRSLLFSVLVLSSTAMAQDAQRFGLGAQLGLHGAVPVTGLELVTPVNENLQMSFAYVQGRTDLADEVETSVVSYIDTADFGISEASATMRYYFSRTFYAGLGAGYRELDMHIEGSDWANRSTFVGDYKSQALQAKAVIGNGWSFSNGFYIAVDWIGFGVPFAVTQSELSATETKYDRSQVIYLNEKTDPEYKHTADRLSRTTMGTLLTLRLGFNF